MDNTELQASESPLPLWVFWEGTPSPLITLCLDSIKLHNPSTRIVNCEDLRQLGASDLLAKIEGVPRFLHADLFRFWLLYKFGGAWLDSDVIATKPLDFLPEVADFDLIAVKANSQNLKIFATPFGARAGSPLMKQAFETVLRKVIRHKEGKRAPYSSTSVGVLTQLAREHRSDKVKLLQQWRYNRIPFQNAGRFFLKTQKDYSESACCYHLTNIVYKDERVRQASREELLSSETQLGYILRKSFNLESL